MLWFLSYDRHCMAHTVCVIPYGQIVLYYIILFISPDAYSFEKNYKRLQKIREFHVIVQKAVLFAPYSRYSWKKRSITTDTKYRTGEFTLRLDEVSY